MIRKLDFPEWLGALNYTRNELRINTCRYDCRNTDWVLERQWMNEHLIFVLEQGFLGVKLNNRRFRMEPGTLVWVPPGRDRELWGRRGKFMLRHYKLRFNLRSRGQELIFDSGIIVRRNLWEILPVFQLMIRESRGLGLEERMPYQSELLRNLIASLSIMVSRSPEVGNIGGRVLNKTQKALLEQFINENIHTGLSSKDVATHLQLSLDYFSRLFRNTYGISPRAYLKNEKIRYAANRLSESSISIKELAFELNYNHINLFCRQFRETMNMTPSQYRDRSRI